MDPIDRLLAKIDPMFKPPAFDQAALPEGLKLSRAHRKLLEKRNGGYFYGGALHVFGACREPAFHGLVPWNDPGLWRAPYGDDLAGLVFFAEDAFGDQFALDEKGHVLRLRAEQGVVEELADDFDQWVLMAVGAPDELLSREIFTQWVRTNGRLPYGSQLQAYPPFMFVEDPADASLEAVDAVENMEFHSAISQAIASIPPGARMKVEFTEDGLQILPAEDGPEPPEGD